MWHVNDVIFKGKLVCSLCLHFPLATEHLSDSAFMYLFQWFLAHFWEGNSWAKITWNKWITPYRWTRCISNVCLTLIVWDCSQVFLSVCLNGCSISILSPFHIQMKMFSVCWNGVRYSIFGSSLLRTEGRAICLAIPPLVHSLACSGRMMYLLVPVATCRWCLLEWWVSRIREVVLMFQAHSVAYSQNRHLKCNLHLPHPNVGGRCTHLLSIHFLQYCCNR